MSVDVNSGLSEGAADLLRNVRQRYLQSPDFNGYHIRGTAVVDERMPAVELIEAGLLQVVTSSDYMNIHICPWPSRRSAEDQINDVDELDIADYGVCLYPTPAGMKGVRLPNRFSGRPYARAMARGKGTLELAYFQFDVLEQYRNDSRFRFGFGDAGASMGLRDEAFEHEDVFERDHVGLSHIGFAYDLSGFDPDDPNSPIVRRVAVFHCDLVSLTPEHQRRWETYQVEGSGLEPHPLWWNSQMGHWPDAVGPFTRLFMELENLNELSTLAFGQNMFRTTERPADLGWLLRSSQREWDEFVVQLDKVLSDNLRPQFFDSAGVAGIGEDRQRIATLNRLQRFMQGGGSSEEEARKLLGPLREVRKYRQGPAHAIRHNITDRTFIHRQIALLSDITDAMGALRHWLASHPDCKEWQEKHKDLKTYML